jgi:hypothetical protein
MEAVVELSAVGAWEETRASGVDFFSSWRDIVLDRIYVRSS